MPRTRLKKSAVMLIFLSDMLAPMCGHSLNPREILATALILFSTFLKTEAFIDPLPMSTTVTQFSIKFIFQGRNAGILGITTSAKVKYNFSAAIPRQRCQGSQMSPGAVEFFRPR
jgi:hypothetical protein